MKTIIFSIVALFSFNLMARSYLYCIHPETISSDSSKVVLVTGVFYSHEKPGAVLYKTKWGETIDRSKTWFKCALSEESGVLVACESKSDWTKKYSLKVFHYDEVQKVQKALLTYEGESEPMELKCDTIFDN